MRTLRLTLTGTLMLALLSGFSGTASAQTEDRSGSDDLVAAEPFAAFTGTMNLFADLRRPDITASPTLPEVRARGDDWLVRVNASDPRLSGRYETSENYDLFVEDGNGAVRTGTGRLTNEDGSWATTFRGFRSPDARDLYYANHYHTIWTGEGGYEGLSAMMVSTPTGQGRWDIEGVVFPGSLPEYPEPMPAT